MNVTGWGHYPNLDSNLCPLDYTVKETLALIPFDPKDYDFAKMLKRSIFFDLIQELAKSYLRLGK